MTKLVDTFVGAIAAKDADALKSTLADNVDFRAVTPKKAWEAASAEDTAAILFGSWFPEERVLHDILSVTEGDAVGDTQHMAYRFAATTPEGEQLVEQQAYFRATDGRIDYLRITCSGFRSAT